MEQRQQLASRDRRIVELKQQLKLLKSRSSAGRAAGSTGKAVGSTAQSSSRATGLEQRGVQALTGLEQRGVQAQLLGEKDAHIEQLQMELAGSIANQQDVDVESLYRRISEGKSQQAASNTQLSKANDELEVRAEIIVCVQPLCAAITLPIVLLIWCM